MSEVSLYGRAYAPTGKLGNTLKALHSGKRSRGSYDAGMPSGASRRSIDVLLLYRCLARSRSA